MTKYYLISSTETMKLLEVNEKGLSAADVPKRRSKYGLNELEEQKRKSTLQVFFEQFKDFLVIILIVAAIVSAFLGEIESTIVILFVVILNSLLGTIQHVKAEQSLNSLKALSAPSAKVLREGKMVEIPSREVVVGDILYLDAGDYVSADGRLLESYSLQINESSLTGESVAVEKACEPISLACVPSGEISIGEMPSGEMPSGEITSGEITSEVLPSGKELSEDVSIGDRNNMVFSGSFITNGRGTAIVTAVGMNTEIGKIANLLDSAKEKKTPLQVSLDHFGKRLAIGIITICLLIFGLDIVRGRELVDSFMFAVSLAVAAIPEALSSIVTIVLAFGTQKMAKENAIIRKLHAVESLGSISVICSDKTGTLTQNKMTVQKVFLDLTVKQHDQLEKENSLQYKFVLMALLCNDSVTLDKKEIGDPTEVALVNFGEEYDLDELTVREKYPRKAEVPFDSNRKLMSTVHKINEKTIMITKGAVDVLLTRIVKVETSKGILDLTEDMREGIERVNQHFSMDGLRVLAFAYKEVAEGKDIHTEDEKDLIFVGLTAMMDPPRKESKDAVKNCVKAGIKPVMITGDHKVTASAIAKQIGILNDSSEAIEGYDVEKMTDNELMEKVGGISVYARVSPEHKIRIVKAWQKKGNIVAMTGDGVNDAPALKEADIGIAMGITGTEVAKDASSMVLTDDNFATIVKAISNGRSIYENIKNAIKFLLSGNTGAILTVLYATIFALPAPFLPVHLLFINLLTDSLPAIAIGLEPHNDRLMNEKPRDIHTPLLNKSFATNVIMEGLIIAIVTIIAFSMGLSTGDYTTASTMAFATLCLSRLLHGFNSRSKQSIFKIGVFTNKFSWLAFILGIALLHIVLFVPPLMSVFEVASLTGMQLGYIYSLAMIPLVVIQLYKLLFVRDIR